MTALASIAHAGRGWQFAIVAACAVLGAACGGGSVDARYPSRAPGCPVKSYPGDPPAPLDDLGVVTVDCSASGGACARQVLDAVLAKGGDVAWGLGENELTTTHIVAHAGHTRRVTQGPHERGCPVRVFPAAPTVRTENIGPVIAVCGQDDTPDACLRELEDQVCLLGGDVLWQVDGPTPVNDKQRMQGRAATAR